MLASQRSAAIPLTCAPLNVAHLITTCIVFHVWPCDTHSRHHFFLCGGPCSTFACLGGLVEEPDRIHCVLRMNFPCVFHQLAGRHSARQLQRRGALCLEWPGSIFGAKLAIELGGCIWLEFILQFLPVSCPYPASIDVSRCQSARKRSRFRKAEKPGTIQDPIHT